MKGTIQQLLDRSRHRPEGYIGEVLRAAGIAASPDVVKDLVPGLVIEIPDLVYAALCAKYRPELPSLIALATDYKTAIQPWLDAGYPVLDAPTAGRRADTCALCAEFKLKDGHLTCRAYGCPPLKFWLKPALCFLEKWPTCT